MQDENESLAMQQIVQKVNSYCFSYSAGFYITSMFVAYKSIMNKRFGLIIRLTASLTSSVAFALMYTYSREITLFLKINKILKFVKDDQESKMYKYYQDFLDKNSI